MVLIPVLNEYVEILYSCEICGSPFSEEQGKAVVAVQQTRNNSNSDNLYFLLVETNLKFLVGLLCGDETDHDCGPQC